MKCIYAILNSNGTAQKPGCILKGINEFPIYYLNYKDISAAVSDMEKNKLKVDVENAFAYEKIMESFTSEYNLLPVRFGTLVEDDDGVIGILERHYEQFLSSLRQIKGKLEYGLKILLDIEEAAFQEKALTEAVDIRGFEQLEGSSPHKKYLLEKLKAHKFDEILVKKIDVIIEDIHCPLRDLSFLSKFRKMLTKKMILDAVYLVERKKKDIFMQKFEELKEKHKNLKFLLTGPWPPYNFVGNFDFKKGDSN